MISRMGDTTLKKPAASPRRSRAEWDAIIRDREAKDEQRKALNSQADKLKREIEKIDAELVALVEHDAAEAKEKRVTLKSFILSIVYRKPYPMQLAFKAYGKLSDSEKAELVDEVGLQQKLEIQWRDERPAPSAAAA